MAKRTVRSRSVQAPKVRGSIPLEKIDRAIREVASRLSLSPDKTRVKRRERAGSGQR